MRFKLDTERQKTVSCLMHTTCQKIIPSYRQARNSFNDKFQAKERPYVILHGYLIDMITDYDKMLSAISGPVCESAMKNPRGISGRSPIHRTGLY